MRQQTGRRWLVPVVAWGLCGLFAVMWLATLGLYLGGSGDLDQVLSALASGWALVGALVAVREPRNAVGWLMLVIALAFGFQGLVDAYAADPDRPGVTAAAWVSGCIWYFWLYLSAVMLPLLFPDGRLLSKRWRVAFGVAVAALVCTFASSAFMPGPLDVDAPVAIVNPWGIEDAEAALSALSVAGDVLVTIGFALGTASLVVRLRRSSGRKRQQVAWFAYVGALALGSLLLAMVDVFADRAGDPGSPGWAEVAGTIGWLSALLLITVGLPVAVGVAILRHRLYDIDLVVKRTLVYGSLTLVLAGVYTGLVVSLPLLLGPLASTSDLAVAASTLAVAALFRPVRGRIQQVVDRRFYRRKYDATRTVESFAGRLRHEVDLAAVSSDLERVVRDTVQPTHVSLWLRGTS